MLCSKFHSSSEFSAFILRILKFVLSILPLKMVGLDIDISVRCRQPGLLNCIFRLIELASCSAIWFMIDLAVSNKLIMWFVMAVKLVLRPPHPLFSRVVLLKIVSAVGFAGSKFLVNLYLILLGAALRSFRLC